MKTILLLVHADQGQKARLLVALAVVRAIGGHLTCLDITVYPAIAGVASPAVLYSDEVRREAQNKASMEAKLPMEAICWDWMDARGSLDDSLIKASGLTDLIVVSTMIDRSSRQMHGVVGEVLMRSRRPLFAVPEDVSGLDVAGHAIVAWDGSDASINALRSSVPLLRLARIVTILEIEGGTIETASKDAAAYLSRYGIAATIQTQPRFGDDVTTALMRQIEVLEADYLIMGGFGHSRMREAIFGGVTRRILDECSIPVLLAS